MPFVRSKIVYIMRKQKETLPGANVEDAKYCVGSSLTQEGVSNKGLTIEEELKYLPQLVGSDPNKQDWGVKTENYWKNIRVPIPYGTGLRLEVGFIYPDEETAKADKEVEVEVRPGIKATFLTGKGAIAPISVPNYVLYRYCLVYSKVAKSEADIEASPKIRFYLHSKEEETKRKISAIELEKKAFAAYMKVSSDLEMAQAVLYSLRVDNVEKIDKQDYDLILNQRMKEDPARFIKVAEDKNLTVKMFIERCIAKGLLKRIPNTETVLMDDTVIGNTASECVAYVTNERNKSIITTLEARLKGLKTT